MMSVIDSRQPVSFFETNSSLETSIFYSSDHRPNSSITNLALAILLQGFRDVISVKNSSNHEGTIWRKDALEWFASENQFPGSFLWVCTALKLPGKELRTWIEEYLMSDKKRKIEMARKLHRFQIRH